ncbi:hypothetical protein BDF19DRAFT_434538 [Syncephalis fuscata]|nr:hypothetical protein BDF19DRAFT_434538 [Syncephalis fuscata]
MSLSNQRRRGKKATGLLQVVILQVMLNVPATKLYVRLSLGDQIYQTSVSEQETGRWHEGFEFDVSFHNQLFGVCQLDLYDMRYLLPDRHLGRAEISLAHLRSMPDQFTTFYEFWDRRHTVANLGQAALTRTLSSNLGAVQVRIGHRFTQPTNRYSIGADFHILSASPSMYAHLDQRFQRRLRAAVSKAAEREFIKNEQESGDDTPADGDQASFQSLSDDDSLNNELEEQNLVDFSGIMSRGESRISNRSIMESLSNLLVTEETRQVLKAIMRLYMIFGQGLEVGHVELMAGSSILRSYFAQVPIIRTGDTVDRLIDIDLPAHFYRFCMASYGWRGLNFFGKGNGIIRDSIRKHSDAASVREYLSLEEEDLLAYEFNGSLVFRPSYFIARDKETNSIVLCIRGTMSIMDTLTDLVCDYQQWKGGLVHAGILSAAQWFFTDVIPQMLAYCRQHDVRRIRILGHSLGGSTASVLTILLVDYLRMLDNIDADDEYEGETEPIKQSSHNEQQQEQQQPESLQNATTSTKPTDNNRKRKSTMKSRLLPGEMDVRCYSYGGACCVSLDISRQYTDVIDAYVLDNDLVPRLSYGSVMDLKSMMLCAAGLTDRPYEEVVSFGFLSTKVTEEEWQSRYQILDASRQRLTNQDTPQNPKLFLAGTIHHLYRELSHESPATPMNSIGRKSRLSSIDGQGTYSASSGDAIAEELRTAPLTAEPVHKQTAETVQSATNEPSMRMETSDTLKYSEVLIAPNMFLDHMPSAYEAAFEQARQCFIRDAATTSGIAG